MHDKFKLKKNQFVDLSDVLVFCYFCSQIHRKRLVICDWSDYLDRHLKKIVEYAHCYTAPAPILVAQKSNSNKRMTNTSKNCKHSQIMHASFPHFVTSSVWSEVAVFQTSLISCLSSFFYYSTFGVLFFVKRTHYCVCFSCYYYHYYCCAHENVYIELTEDKKIPVPTSFCMRSDFSFLS